MIRKLALALVVLFLSGCQTGVSKDEVARVYYNLGNAYFEMKQFSRAVEAYQNALVLEPGLIKASYNLCRVYLESDSIDKGMEILDELLLRDPDNALLKETRAWAFHLAGDDEKALEIYAEILERDSVSETALFNSGYLYRENGRNEEAIDVLEQLLALDADYPDLTVILAELQYSTGGEERAEQLLITHLEDQPNDPLALRALAVQYFREELFGDSLAYMDRFLEQSKETDGEAWFLKAFIHLTVTEEEASGLSALRTACEAGYHDREMIFRLYEDPNLTAPDKTEEILNSWNLLIGGDESGSGPAGPEPPGSSDG